MCSRLFEKLWVLSFFILLLFPQEAQSHVFRLYSDTNEETKERIIIDLAPPRFSVEYSGEYHGQLAAHIRFMMDTDQDGIVSSKEERLFTKDYQQMWFRKTDKQILNIDGVNYHIEFNQCTFPDLKKSNLIDPLFVKMRFQIDDLQISPPNQTNNHMLEIGQRLLFQFGQQFIEMSKTRAAFTNEQENAIGRFFQVKIHATDNIKFTQCYPGYINRRKNMISGIFFDETSARIQFLPYPKISASFMVIDE
ncbi:MAG: hypothetical protein U9N83_05665 [Thermodesulfobacteriota bacterium]|nr:hypothetical protein [Thermodesulfobacteriota bacterium]